MKPLEACCLRIEFSNGERETDKIGRMKIGRMTRDRIHHLERLFKPPPSTRDRICHLRGDDSSSSKIRDRAHPPRFVSQPPLMQIWCEASKGEKLVPPKPPNTQMIQNANNRSQTNLRLLAKRQKRGKETTFRLKLRLKRGLSWDPHLATLLTRGS